MASVIIGLLAVRFLKFPQWITLALAFNNTTSLPLVLVQSLDATGILNSLLRENESTSAAIERAKSYFLVCAVMGNCLTFAIGPRLIDCAPGSEEDENGKTREHRDEHTSMFRAQTPEPREADDDERTSLLPRHIRLAESQAERWASHKSRPRWERLTPRTQTFLLFLYDFLNAPLIGAFIGCIIGLVPALHRAFFAPSQEGGFFDAWLTSSLKNIGQLFVSLQILVVGVSLSSSLRKMKRGEDSGHLRWGPTLFVLFVRFVLWPVISIFAIWILITKTNWLSDDPILWFAMIIMPTGPPAIKLVAMADVSRVEEAEKMIIAKLLTVSADCPSRSLSSGS